MSLHSCCLFYSLLLLLVFFIVAFSSSRSLRWRGRQNSKLNIYRTFKEVRTHTVHGRSFREQTVGEFLHHVKCYMASKLTKDCFFRASCIRTVYTSSAFALPEHKDVLALHLCKPYYLTEEIHDGTQSVMLETNYQLKELVKAGHLNDARQMFDRLSRRDEITWTTMISCYVNASDPTEALALFYNMWVDSTLQMDPFAVSLALKACAASFDTKNGESVHGYCVKTGLWSSVFVGSSLLDMYMKVGKLCEGCKVFQEMPIRNIVSWTAIITGLVRAGYSKEGLAYFSKMWRSGIQCDSYAFAIALKACADAGFLNYGKEIHTYTIKRGFDVGSFVANTLATMYNKCGKLSYGLCLFEKMSTPDVVSWTTIITTYVQMGQERYAFEAFIRMRHSNTCPNEYTFAAVISACANVSKISFGEQLHAHVLHVGHLGYLSVANSIMTMYSKCGFMKSSSLVFDEMTQRDVVSWSTIIAGYAQGGFGEEAFEILSQMRREGPKPTEFALASVLSVCGSMAIIDQGKQLHAHVLSVGLEHTAMIRSALINMYSKCGSITEASMIFNVSEINDIVSWTAMINGYAEHGSSQEAINLFNRVEEAGFRPDSVTFIGVLSACSHAGKVDLGFQYFNLMSSKYKLSPSKEHYGCMIDLLCRAGRLSEAEQMINSMPFERDDVVWSTLLRACRIHGDVDCGKRAADQIIQLDPNCAGTHITLANMYSAKGQWREAADVRKIMRSKGVIKEPGWSLIKVKDQSFAFVAGDRSHSQLEDIYGILELVGSMAEFASLELVSLLDDVD